MHESPRHFGHCRPIVAALATLATGAAALAQSVDWPVFEPGLWTFERTRATEGSTRDKVTRTECVDPTEEQRKQMDMLAKSGCEFTPLTRDGKVYRYSANCRMGGTTSSSESVLEVEGDDSYTITIESIVNGAKSHEVLRAKRTGECAR
jgi:hypothetical protein